MIENAFVRVAAANQVQEFTEDIFCLYKGEITEDAIASLKSYLKKSGVRIPKPDDEKQRDEITKMMYVAWASMECLDLMCGLNGEEL